MSLPRHILPAALLAAAILALSVRDISAQPQVLPQQGLQLPPGTQVGGAAANWSQAPQGGGRPAPNGGFNPVPVAPGGYTPWNPYGSVMTPAYGYLSGASEVIGAQGQFMIQQQQATAMQEQTKQTKLDTRRKTLEEWRYEQSLLPTAEELRSKQELADINRARNNPPSVDIWNGTALNFLLTDLQKMQSVGMAGPSVMLDPAMLSRVNVTDGTSFGQGLLQDGGKLTWPYALELEYFDTGRKRMDAAMANAVAVLQAGKRVPAPQITEMLKIEDALRADLKAHINDLTPTQGVQARRYINELHDTIGTMQEAKASNFVTGRWSAQGNSVAELVMYLTKNGLKFAPAGSGDEAAYTSLYQSMVSYDRMLSGMARR